MRTIDELAAAARNAVSLGADLVRSAIPHQVREKGDRDVVTDVDIKTEQEIRAYLARHTPECGFLGEEEGQIGDTDYTWILDPIDGTSNFAHGLPLCAVSLALVHHSETVIAEIAAPFLGLRYSATRGGGAFVNGDRMQASRTSELAKAIVSIGDYAVGADAEAKNRQRLHLTTLLAEQAERVRMFGSAALDLAWIAEGRTDAAIILANKPWDIAAGVLLAREAGALALDGSGGPHTFDSPDTVVTCSGLADAIVALVRSAYR